MPHPLQRQSPNTPLKNKAWLPVPALTFQFDPVVQGGWVVRRISGWVGLVGWTSSLLGRLIIVGFVLCAGWHDCTLVLLLEVACARHFGVGGWMME